MAFSISATLGFHGESLASSGTSALQDRATGLVPPFLEWLKVFFEDCGNENEFVDSVKTLTEVSKTSHFQENLQKKQLLWKSQLAPPCPRITLSELKALRVNRHILNPALKKRVLGARAASKLRLSWHFRFWPPWAFMADLWRARARARCKTEQRD